MENNKEILTVNSINGDSYVGFKLNHQRYLPKSASLYKCDMEFNTFKPFNVYKKISKKDVKFYIVFTSYLPF
tara:strand:- start:432 stop:647 length:216 start_codon:yes stop_codon:yes gene_type:complete